MDVEDFLIAHGPADHTMMRAMDYGPNRKGKTDLAKLMAI